MDEESVATTMVRSVQLGGVIALLFLKPSYFGIPGVLGGCEVLGFHQHVNPGSGKCRGLLADEPNSSAWMRPT